jgi:thioredoxin-like negative regulator of GroEL
MHRKYKDRGFAAVSVSVDDSTDKEAVAEAAQFLREHKATFTNYLLVDGQELLKPKLGVVAVPCVYVFNRAGKYVKKYTEAPPAEEIDRLVEELLQEPAPKKK